MLNQRDGGKKLMEVILRALAVTNLLMVLKTLIQKETIMPTLSVVEEERGDERDLVDLLAISFHDPSYGYVQRTTLL